MAEEFAFIEVKVPPSPGFGIHASGVCNALCSPPRHVDIAWCHPRYPLGEVPADTVDRTFGHWLGLSARVIGRAELPPRAEDGWIAWTVEVTE